MRSVNMKMNILTSHLSIAIAALCIGGVALVFQLAFYGFELSFCFVGIHIGLWGSMSASMITWKQAKPDDPDIQKYQTIGSLTLLFGTSIIVLLLFLKA